MRDQRFIAAHRGGPLDLASHRLLAAWAADCAERVLPYFTKHSSDERPHRAIETARAWARGEVPVGVAQKAAVAAHAAARAVKDKSASAAARAAGHAVATAHMADHCLGAPWYAQKALAAAGELAELEQVCHVEKLPDELQKLILSALRGPRFKRRMG
jgi:hypothetical protein